MNILNTPQFTGKTKGAKASGGDVLNVLGNHKQLTPEQLKALQAKGKLKGDSGVFETLLKESNQKQNPKLAKLAANKNLKDPLAAKQTKGMPGQQLLANQQLAPEQKQVSNPAAQKNHGKVQDEVKGQIKSQVKGHGKVQAQVIDPKLQNRIPNIAPQGKQVQQRTLTPGMKQQAQAGIKNHNRDVMNQPVGAEVGKLQIPIQKGNHQVTPQGERPVARVLKLGQSKNIKATQNNPQINAGQLGKMNNPQVQAQNNVVMNQRPVAMVGPQAQSMNATQKASVHAAQNKAPVKNSNLVDFSTFMKKQNPQAKNRIASKHAAYEKKAAKKSMFKSRIDKTLPHAVKKQATPTKLQDVMFKGKNEEMGANLDQQMNNQNIQNVGKAAAATVGTEQTAKVFDMAQMTGTNTSEEVIAKIQDYAIQTKFSNEPQLEFTFKHHDLGQIDLTVQKAVGDQMNILVGANSTEAMKFFTQNQGELLQSLTQAGISVADFKLESSGKSNNQNLSQNSGGNGQNTQKEHQSQSGQRQEEQQKRAELWDQLKDKEAA